MLRKSWKKPAPKSTSSKPYACHRFCGMTFALSPGLADMDGTGWRSRVAGLFPLGFLTVSRSGFISAHLGSRSKLALREDS